jgi:hypothetical protein
VTMKIVAMKIAMMRAGSRVENIHIKDLKCMLFI